MLGNRIYNCILHKVVFRAAGLQNEIAPKKKNQIDTKNARKTKKFRLGSAFLT